MAEKEKLEVQDDAIERAAETLRVLREVLEKGIGNLSEMMKTADDPIKTLLEKVLEPTGLAELFPEDVLRSGGLVEGLGRLRHGVNGRWGQVMNGRKEKEIDEIYNHLRLVRIPMMALKILKTMDSEPVVEVAALTAEQYEQYNHLKELSWKVLDNAVTVLGTECAAALLKTEAYVLQTCLKKFKP